MATQKKKTGARKKRAARVWSAEVTRRSHALDLDDKVFRQSPGRMARSLKRSAERSKRRKGSPFQSAMSMLNFYENRAGRNLPASRKQAIRRAKDELRALYGRPTRA
jgi:hypothetical protein